MTLAIVPEWCWDGTAGAQSEAAVVVEGARVSFVGDRDRVPWEAERLALPGYTLMPGLIDCHVHLVDNPEATDEDVSVSMGRRLAMVLAALRAVLDNGFTTVRTMGSALPVPLELMVRDAVEAGLVPGPRLVVAPHLISARGGHGDHSAQAGGWPGTELGFLADGEQEILRAVRTESRLGADWVKFCGTGGFFSPSDRPEQVTYTQREMDVLVAAAADLGLPCAVHAFGDEGVRRAVRAGARSVEHGSLAGPDTLAEMEQRGTFLVPTQSVLFGALRALDDDAYWSGRPDQAREKFRACRDRLHDGAAALCASGVRIAYGTDAGMLPHRDNGEDFVTLVENGFAPLRVLRAATSTAAELLALPDVGRIAVGARADLVAVRGDPFTDITAMTRVGLVVRDGEVRKNTTGHGRRRGTGGDP
ncbi:amidohydrolase family protein [Streptomyces capparidis]